MDGEGPFIRCTTLGGDIISLEVAEPDGGGDSRSGKAKTSWDAAMVLDLP